MEKEQHKEPGYVYILTNPSFREDWVKNWQKFTSCRCSLKGT